MDGLNDTKARRAAHDGPDLFASLQPADGACECAESATTLATFQLTSRRDRLAAHLRAGAGESMADEELLELLLDLAGGRGDQRALAGHLIKRFGSLAAIVAAAPAALNRAGLGDGAVLALKATRAAAVRMARTETMKQPMIGSWNQLLDYCRTAMAHAPAESMRAVFLDRKNRVIVDEEMWRGTIDHTAVYPREIAKRALEHDALAVVLVHNHPSGEPEPSRADIEMTKEVGAALKTLGVTLHDHLIVARAGHYSFKAQGLLS